MVIPIPCYLGAALLLVSLAGEAQRPPIQTVESNGFRIVAGCHETKLRTVVAALHWKTDKASVDTVRVDVTVFSGGFDKNLFASLTAPARGGKFVPSAELAKSAPNVTRAFDLSAGPATFDDRAGFARLLVENLEPGLLYSFRLAGVQPGGSPHGPLTVEAPVCVADMKEGR